MKETVEILIDLDEDVYARMELIAEHALTDKATVVQVLLAASLIKNGVLQLDDEPEADGPCEKCGYPSRRACEAVACEPHPLLEIDSDEPSDAMMAHIASVVNQDHAVLEAIGDNRADVLARVLEKWADDCEQHGTGVFIPNACSGDVFDTLKEAACLVPAANAVIFGERG